MRDAVLFSVMKMCARCSVDCVGVYVCVCGCMRDYACVHVCVSLCTEFYFMFSFVML